MAKLHIQGRSANHGDNKNVGPKKYPTGSLRIQDSSANYAGLRVSTKRTPSPAAKPYPAATRNAPKSGGTKVLPRSNVR